jgi:hypothetical protein
MDNRIKDAIRTFPPTFGLSSFPNLTFRISERNSYVNDDDQIQLYTQVLRDGVWMDFAKGTPSELQRYLVSMREENTDIPISHFLIRKGYAMGVLTDCESCGRTMRSDGNCICEPIEPTYLSNL